MSEFEKALEGLHWEGVLVEYDSAVALEHVSSVASALRWLWVSAYIVWRCGYTTVRRGEMRDDTLVCDA
jgi:hypothetical protein